MRWTVDTKSRTIQVEHTDGGQETLPLYSKESFELISQLWVKVGWDQKYPYAFSWMGRPVIQLPEDLIRTQEAIYRIKPDVILETGVAHGGSLIFYASLCKAMGHGRVIGVDIEIRPHNRRAIEAHELASYITLVEGNAVAPETVAQVKSLIPADAKTLVLLDSCHTRAHVLAELEAYHDLVSPGSYIVATDGVMMEVFDVPRGKPEWEWDHPTGAAADFAAQHPEFALVQPPWPFSETPLEKNVTHWPAGWLERKAA